MRVACINIWVDSLQKPLTVATLHVGGRNKYFLIWTLHRASVPHQVLFPNALVKIALWAPTTLNCSFLSREYNLAAGAQRVAWLSTMAEAGDGNIKVVVRCRPLNSRGKFKGQHTSKSTFGLLYLLLIILRFQNSRVGQSHSSGCKATRPFSILPKSAPHRTRNAQRSARLCHLASTRVTGQQVRGMNLATARNKRSTMTWEKNC